MKLQLTRNVTQAECPWLKQIDILEIEKDHTVYQWTGPTYGCVSQNGIAVTLEKGKVPFFELPKDAVKTADFQTVGIVCDNFKREKFRSELDKAGYEWKESAFTDKTTTITIECPTAKIHSVKTLCEHVENHFKRRN